MGEEDMARRHDAKVLMLVLVWARVQAVQREANRKADSINIVASKRWGFLGGTSVLSTNRLGLMFRKEPCQRADVRNFAS